MFNANRLSLSILVTSPLCTFSPLSLDHHGEADKASELLETAWVRVWDTRFLLTWASRVILGNPCLLSGPQLPLNKIKVLVEIILVSIQLRDSGSKSKWRNDWRVMEMWSCDYKSIYPSALIFQFCVFISKYIGVDSFFFSSCYSGCAVNLQTEGLCSSSTMENCQPFSHWMLALSLLFEPLKRCWTAF